MAFNIINIHAWLLLP